MKEIVKSLVLGYRSKESYKNRIGRHMSIYGPTYLLLSPRKDGRNNHTQACKGCVVRKNPPPSSQSEGKDIQNFMKFLVSIV